MQRGGYAVDDSPRTVVLRDGAVVGQAWRERIGQIVPHGHASAKEDVIFINGINTVQEGFVKDLDVIDNAAQGAHVLGVFNASRGPARDWKRGYFDQLDPKGNPAIISMAKAIEHVAAAKRNIVIVAHSQGAAAVSQALRIAREALYAKYNPDQVAEMLASLRIETHGAAGCNFIDGPRYVHYINSEDPLPHMMGLSRGLSLSTIHYPGKNAVFRYFTQRGAFHQDNPKAGPLEKIFDYYDDVGHSLSIYAQHRVPFDEAYAAGSNKPGPAERRALWAWAPVRILIDIAMLPVTIKHLLAGKHGLL